MEYKSQLLKNRQTYFIAAIVFGIKIDNVFRDVIAYISSEDNLTLERVVTKKYYERKSPKKDMCLISFLKPPTNIN